MVVLGPLAAGKYWKLPIQLHYIDFLPFSSFWGYLWSALCGPKLKVQSYYTPPLYTYKNTTEVLMSIKQSSLHSLILSDLHIWAISPFFTFINHLALWNCDPEIKEIPLSFLKRRGWAAGAGERGHLSPSVSSAFHKTITGDPDQFMEQITSLPWMFPVSPRTWQ